MITGWAGNPKTGQPADVVLLVVDDEVATSASPLERRRDVEHAHKDARLGMSGFSLWVEAETFKNGARASVVAVTGEEAARLPLGVGVTAESEGLATFRD